MPKRKEPAPGEPGGPAIHVSDIPEPTPGESKAQERGYRRGYRSGWQQGIDALFEQYAAHNGGEVPEAFKRAYQEAWDFWHVGDLYNWQARREDTAAGRAYLPPSLPKPKTT
jgi:hypothetical protein